MFDIEDLATHRASWRAMLVQCAERAACIGDEVDREYYNHEIEVFDRTFAVMAVAVEQGRVQIIRCAP